MKPDGSIEWSEACYCPTPLAHERATVFDLHFSDIATEQINGPIDHQGSSFLFYLEEIAKRA